MPHRPPKNNAERLDNLADAMVEDLLSMSDEEIAAEAVEDGVDMAAEAARTRKVVGRAMRQAAHDRGDWMNWQAGEAWVHDGGTYEAEMTDGTRQIVTAEVYGAEEASLLDATGEGIDDHTISRIRLI
jgi:hypothetical protein